MLERGVSDRKLTENIIERSGKTRLGGGCVPAIRNACRHGSRRKVSLSKKVDIVTKDSGKQHYGYYALHIFAILSAVIIVMYAYC